MASPRRGLTTLFIDFAVSIVPVLVSSTRREGLRRWVDLLFLAFYAGQDAWIESDVVDDLFCRLASWLIFQYPSDVVYVVPDRGVYASASELACAKCPCCLFTLLAPCFGLRSSKLNKGHAILCA